MDADSKLKLCPFCNGFSFIEGDKDSGYCVLCSDCYCIIGEYFKNSSCVSKGIFKTEQEAIDAWNKRKGE